MALPVREKAGRQDDSGLSGRFAADGGKHGFDDRHIRSLEDRHQELPPTNRLLQAQDHQAENSHAALDAQLFGMRI